MSEMKCAVVCVDDDPYILQMLGFQLSKIMDQSQTLIEYFTDPNQALENIDLLIDEQIDVIFVMVDYQMPKMTGAELIRKLKLKHKYLPLLLVKKVLPKMSIKRRQSQKKTLHKLLQLGLVSRSIN